MALTTKHPMYAEWVASELVWYVKPESRQSRVSLQLFSAFEYWAKEVVKADKIQVSNLAGMDIVERFYRKKDYTLMEKVWIK